MIEPFHTINKKNKTSFDTNSMSNFLDDNFLLRNRTAQRLFHEVAKDLPVVDFHNHLNPAHLAANKRFADLAQLWVNEDPYKHRAMRICGVPEERITGAISDREKFSAWAETLPKTVGNPLFHWSCLELKRLFGIHEILTPNNAEDIWNRCNEMLTGDYFGALDILKKWNTEIVCTSDDLIDDLSAHQTVTAGESGIKVLPSLRGDSMIAFNESSPPWMKNLSQKFGETKSLEDYQAAIKKALDAFVAAGCRLSDHSLDAGFLFSTTTEADASRLFNKFQKEGALMQQESIQLKSYLLLFLGKEYDKRGWTLQLHIGAQRYTSSRLRKLVGPAGGYATIGTACDITSLCRFLDAMESGGNLPQTILYTLNPADYAAFATLTGSYAADGVSGKIQFGPAWWYNDHYEGIRQQLLTLSSYGLLSQFIGMTTDSRSLLSFSRHEYFRRVLCNIIGDWVEGGELPEDEELLSSLVKNICYNNSKNFLFNNDQWQQTTTIKLQS